jgi:hypothetical protein
MTSTSDSARDAERKVVLGRVDLIGKIRTGLAPAANDNQTELSRDGLLRAALRHFAEHGLGAAEQAQRNAEEAFFAGNRKEYRHWLDICRALDRRMADAVHFHGEGGGAAREQNNSPTG